MGSGLWAPVAAQSDLDTSVEDDAPADAVVPDPATGATAQERANMANVLEFHEAAFNAKDFERARFYVGGEYVQHNPNAADGLEGFEAYVGSLLETAPETRRTVEALYAEGDFVILHVRTDPGDGTPGDAVFDIFRLDADGKIAEHWDVAQTIPAADSALNENGPFYGETSPEPTPATLEQEAEYKEIAAEFHERAFNAKDADAALEVVDADFLQHDPEAADGPDGLRAAIETLRSDFPQSRSTVEAAYADGDRVALHVLSRASPDDRGEAAVHLFRIADGKVAEHWSVTQPIPESSLNDNGMFYGD